MIRMKGKNPARLVGGLLLLGIMILILFYWLNNRPDDSVFSDETTKNTEARKLLGKDMERYYPSSVREVVRLYSRITKCWYNEKISSEELEGLIEMQRKLFDRELLEENPLPDFTAMLTQELKEQKEKKSTMINYRVQKESSVKKWEAAEGSFASIIACYMIKNSTEGYRYTYEEFLLREDEKGRWKIVGWQLTAPIEIED